MEKVILWQKEDGSWSVTYPVWSTKLPGETDDLFLARIAAQASGGRPYSTTTSSQIPALSQAHDVKKEIMDQLADIDRKKIRAMTDYFLTSDGSRLYALEEHAILLRNQLVKG